MRDSTAVKELQRENDRLTATLAAAAAMGKYKPRGTPAPFYAGRGRGRGKAERKLSAALLLSDWHVGELVEERGPDGALLGVHGPKAATRKVEQLGDAALAVGDRHTAGAYALDHLTVALLGDFMTGYIHPECVETVAVPPVEEAYLATRLVGDFLERIAAHTPARTVRVVCRHGNHSRTTPENRLSTGAGHSWETFMYYMLRRALDRVRTRAGNPLEWVIDTGLQTYTVEPVIGRVRWIHGHEIRFGSGILGPLIPIARHVQRWDALPGCQAALTAMGHFHQLTVVDGPPGLAVNGSLIGGTRYSLSLGHFAAPAQAHLVYSAHHGCRFAVDELRPAAVPRGCTGAG